MKRLLALTLLAMTGCTAQLVGPPANLAAIAAPAPEAPLVAPQPAPQPMPEAPGGYWQVWVPPTTAPSGERSEGHWLLVPQQAPPLERLEPAVLIPHAPTTPHVLSKGPEAPAQIPVAPGTSTHAPMPAPTPPPVQPRPSWYGAPAVQSPWGPGMLTPYGGR